MRLLPLLRDLTIAYITDPARQVSYTLGDRVENSRLRNLALRWSHSGRIPLAACAGAAVEAAMLRPHQFTAGPFVLVAVCACLWSVSVSVHYAADVKQHPCPLCPEDDGPGDGGDGPDPEPGDVPDDPHGRIVDRLIADLDQQWAALSDAARDGAF